MPISNSGNHTERNAKTDTEITHTGTANNAAVQDEHHRSTNHHKENNNTSTKNNNKDDNSNSTKQTSTSLSGSNVYGNALGIRREWNFTLTFKHQRARFLLECSPIWEFVFIDPDTIDSLTALDVDVLHCPFVPLIKYVDRSAVIVTHNTRATGTASGPTTSSHKMITTTVQNNSGSSNKNNKNNNTSKKSSSVHNRLSQRTGNNALERKLSHSHSHYTSHDIQGNARANNNNINNTVAPASTYSNSNTAASTSGEWWMEKAKTVEVYYTHMKPNMTLVELCKNAVQFMLHDISLISVDNDNRLSRLRISNKLKCPYRLNGQSSRCFQFQCRLHKKGDVNDEFVYSIGTCVGSTGYLFLIRCRDYDELLSYVYTLFLPHMTDGSKLKLDVLLEYNKVSSIMLGEQQERFGELYYEDRDAAISFSVPMYPMVIKADFSPAKTVGVGSIACMTFEMDIYEKLIDDVALEEVLGVPKFRVNKVILFLDVEDVVRMKYPTLMSTEEYSLLKLDRLLATFPEAQVIGLPTTVNLGDRVGRSRIITFKYDQFHEYVKVIFTSTLVGSCGVTAFYLTKLGGGVFDSHLYMYLQLIQSIRYLLHCYDHHSNSTKNKSPEQELEQEHAEQDEHELIGVNEMNASGREIHTSQAHQNDHAPLMKRLSAVSRFVAPNIRIRESDLVECYANAPIEMKGEWLQRHAEMLKRCNDGNGGENAVYVQIPASEGGCMGVQESSHSNESFSEEEEEQEEEEEEEEQRKEQEKCYEQKRSNGSKEDKVTELPFQSSSTNHVIDDNDNNHNNDDDCDDDVTNRSSAGTKTKRQNKFEVKAEKYATPSPTAEVCYKPGKRNSILVQSNWSNVTNNAININVDSEKEMNLRNIDGKSIANNVTNKEQYETEERNPFAQSRDVNSEDETEMNNVAEEKDDGANDGNVKSPFHSNAKARRFSTTSNGSERGRRTSVHFDFSSLEERPFHADENSRQNSNHDIFNHTNTDADVDRLDECNTKNYVFADNNFKQYEEREEDAGNENESEGSDDMADSISFHSDEIIGLGSVTHLQQDTSSSSSNSSSSYNEEEEEEELEENDNNENEENSDDESNATGYNGSDGNNNNNDNDNRYTNNGSKLSLEVHNGHSSPITRVATSIPHTHHKTQHESVKDSSSSISTISTLQNENFPNKEEECHEDAKVLSNEEITLKEEEQLRSCEESWEQQTENGEPNKINTEKEKESIKVERNGEEEIAKALSYIQEDHVIYSGANLKEVYIRSCEVQQCKPNSYLLQKLPTDPRFTYKVEELDLSSNYLGHNGFVAVLELFKHLPQLRHISLNNMSLDNSDVELLCDALKAHAHICEIDLRDNVNITLPSTRNLSRLLRQNNRIKSIKLSGTRLGEAVIAKLEADASANAHV